MPAINWVLNAFVNVGEAPKVKEAKRMLTMGVFICLKLFIRIPPRKTSLNVKVG